MAQKQLQTAINLTFFKRQNKLTKQSFYPLLKLKVGIGALQELVY